MKPICILLMLLCAAFGLPGCGQRDRGASTSDYTLLTQRTLDGGFLPTELHRDGKMVWAYVTGNWHALRPPADFIHEHLLLFGGALPQAEYFMNDQLFVVHDSDAPVVLSERLLGLALVPHSEESRDDAHPTPHYELQRLKVLPGGGFEAVFHGFDTPDHEFTKTAQFNWADIQAMAADADTSSRLRHGAYGDFRVLPLKPSMATAVAPPVPPTSAVPPYMKAAPPGEALDPATMTAALLRWVKRTKGQTIRVVETVLVSDLDGGPRQLIVLTTSKNLAAITPQNLREMLAREKRERVARQAKEQAAPDRNAPGDWDRRLNAQKQEDNFWGDYYKNTLGLYTYELSLTRVCEPVEYSYAGVAGPLRDEAQPRERVVKRLGATAKQVGFCYYDDIRPLYYFQNAAGQVEYTDGSQEFYSKAELQTLFASYPQIKPGAEIRPPVAGKWQEFLAP